MIQFVENHPKLRGFSKYYSVNIHPQLEQKEPKRLRIVRRERAIRFSGILIGLLGVSIMIHLKYLELALGFGLLFCVNLFSFVFNWGFYSLSYVKTETKNIIMAGVCRFLGWEYSEIMIESEHLDSILEMGLLPQPFDRINFEDRMTGTIDGMDFDAYEVELQLCDDKKTKRHWTKIFEGQILAFKITNKFQGQTLVIRDKGAFNKKRIGALKRVGLVDPVFEKIFEAYGTDQVEARYLLTPVFIQKLVDLEHAVNGKNIRFAFNNGYLLIVIDTKNQYSAGSMSKPLTDAGRTQKILDEIGAIYDVIDGVVKPHVSN